MTHFFGIKIVDTFTCQSLDMKNASKVTVDDKLIFYFEGILPNNENEKICHEKYHKLAKNV